MLVIDGHTHIWRPGLDLSEAMQKEFEYYVGKGESFPFATYEESLKDMDRCGIDKEIILGVFIKAPSWPTTGWMNISNDYIAEAQNKYPDRVIGFATVNPLGGYRAVREIDRAINELGLKGIGEFTTVYCEVALDDEMLFPIYERCEELARERGIPLSIHSGYTLFPWTPFEKQEPGLLWHVLARFPELKIKIDHACNGGTFDHSFHLAQAWPNVYLDFTYVDALYPPFKIMEFLQNAKWAGVLDRCVWGSDYPWVDRKAELDMYRKFPAESEKLGREPVLTEEDIEGFLGGNIQKYLEIK